MAETIVLKKIKAPVWLNFEPVGWKFGQHVYNVMVDGPDSDSEEDEMSDDSSDGMGEGAIGKDTLGDFDQSSLDPTQWKEQDHYSMLGLKKVRYRATAKDIKKAYQQMALLHHPDKQEELDDTRFKCIQIAYEILGNTKRRRGYDSVDPNFDDTIPKQSAANSGDNFYDVFGPVFKRNARWSFPQPVPPLGGPDASLEYLDNFYTFWYDFNSWREFSYHDEENTDKAENRDERRWMEKQNKAMRQKKKKEEVMRIRTLVDNAYACDPRIKKFKEMERNKKEAQKRAKEEALKAEARKKEEEKRLKEEEERRIKEKLEEEERQIQLKQKQEREAMKKASRKERKKLRTFCKEKNYFSASESETVDRMQQIERLCEALTIDSLTQLNEELVNIVDSTEHCKGVIDREVGRLKEKELEEERKMEEARQKAALQKGGASGGGASGDWSREEVQLLIKAVNLYPAGTSRRWVVIAEYINQHVTTKGTKPKEPDQIIVKVKNLKKLDTTDREVENKQAYSNFTDQQVTKTTKTSGVSATPTTRDVGDVQKPWTAEEQKQLETALRTHPVSTPKRWDKIAEMVPTRSKEACMKRFKELVAKVKSKKQ